MGLEKELGFEQDIHPLFLSIDDEKVMNPEEISKILNVHPESVRRWCRDGKLPSYNFGGKYVIMGDEFKAFAKNSRIQPKWQRELNKDEF